MKQHTPGPWFANKSELDACSSLVSIRTVNGGYEITKDVGYQNASLIAAAPDLLAALESCVRSINMMPRTKQAEDIQAECGMFSAVSSARAAIAKAEGV